MRNNRLVSKNKVNIESILYKWLSSNVLSDDGIFVKKIESENRKSTIFIAEDYYYRIKSNLTLTMIIEETAEDTTVEIISSGGKTGLLGISWGSENSAINRIVKVLKENGFIEQEKKTE